MVDIKSVSLLPIKDRDILPTGGYDFSPGTATEIPRGRPLRSTETPMTLPQVRQITRGASLSSRPWRRRDVWCRRRSRSRAHCGGTSQPERWFYWGESGHRRHAPEGSSAVSWNPSLGVSAIASTDGLSPCSSGPPWSTVPNRAASRLWPASGRSAPVCGGVASYRPVLTLPQYGTSESQNGWTRLQGRGHSSLDTVATTC